MTYSISPAVFGAQSAAASLPLMGDLAGRMERADTTARDAVWPDRSADEQTDISSILIEMLGRNLSGGAPAPAECGEASLRRQGLIEILFGAAFPIRSASLGSLRPIWADEAMSRATSMLQLVLLLDARSDESQSALTLQLEQALAKHIALLFRSLDGLSDTVPLPCAEPMRGLLAGIVELFRPAIGELDIVVDLAPLMLPSYKRRALVLASTQIVTAAILHGFRSQKHGRIRVSVARVKASHAMLMIEDDALSRVRSSPPATFDTIDSLARLLEAEMVCRRSELGGAAIELRFPAY